MEAAEEEQVQGPITVPITNALSSLGQLDRDFKEKKADLNKLTKDVKEVEWRLAEGCRYYDSLASENCYLEGVRDIKQKLASDSEREKKEAEDIVDDLRNLIKSILKEIEKEKLNHNTDLFKYETQVKKLSDLFLERRKSYEEVQLALSIKEIEQINVTTEEKLDMCKNNFQQLWIQKKNIENSFVQIHGTLLKNCQELVEENVKETKSLNSENQKLFNRIENIERYLKDLMS